MASSRLFVRECRVPGTSGARKLLLRRPPTRGVARNGEWPEGAKNLQYCGPPTTTTTNPAAYGTATPLRARKSASAREHTRSRRQIRWRASENRHLRKEGIQLLLRRRTSFIFAERSSKARHCRASSARKLTDRLMGTTRNPQADNYANAVRTR